MVPTTERVTNLLALLLERSGKLTQDQIVHELAGQYPEGGAAQRGAFERDKAVLREIGVPIETEVLGGDRAGETAYWVDRHKYELRGLQLDDDERQALQMAVATIRSDFGQRAIWKLGGAVVPTSIVVANLPQADALSTLRTASADRNSVAFDYRDKPRTVDPYALMLRGGFWYLIGHEHEQNETRTYRVDRIDGAVTVRSGSGFERPEGFDPRREFPADPRRLGGDEHEPEVAEVAVAAAAAPMVCHELGRDAVVREHGDGSVVVSVPCSNTAAFRSWVLGLGADAEVLGPPAVRSDIVAWLRSTVAEAGRH